MKKTYVKPEVYFESFELSANIATGCALPINHQVDGCNQGLGDFTGIVFLENTCTAPVRDNGTCYHVPFDATKLFTS